MELNNGSKYLGEFQQDEQSGLGRFNWTFGHNYGGQYQFGGRHGFGVMTWKNGTVYRGQWQNDDMHGHGSLLNDRGQKVQDGYFENNVFVGN